MWLAATIFVCLGTLSIADEQGKQYGKKDQVAGGTNSKPPCPSSDETMNADLHLRNPHVFDELTPDEIKLVSSYMHEKSGLGLHHYKEAEHFNVSYVDYMHLIMPAKDDVLNYLDHSGIKPHRYALVAVVHMDMEKDVKRWTIHYKVGPLDSGIITHTKIMDIPMLSQRFSSLEQGAVQMYVVEPFVNRIKDILMDSYDATFKNEDPDRRITFNYIMPSVDFANPTERKTWFFFMRDLENEVLHPLGLQIHVNHDPRRRPQDWTVERVYYNFQFFNSEEEFVTRYNANTLNKTDSAMKAVNKEFSTLKRRQVRDPGEGTTGTKFYKQHARRFTVTGREVKYKDWSFHFHIHPVKALQLFDVRFGNQRIIYEMGMQELAVQYSGYSPSDMMTAYIDSTELLGTETFEVLLGVDCPNHATLLSNTLFHHGEAKTERNNICIFEWNTGMPLKRHFHIYGDPMYNGMENNALVIRTFVSVYNYDYIHDYVFYAQGNIDVKATLDGYLQTELFHPVHSKGFAFQLHDHIHGVTHNHLAHFKVDFDILGRENRYKQLKMFTTNSLFANEAQYDQNMFVTQEVRTEQQSLYPNETYRPTTHLFYNENGKNKYGNHRSWEVTIGTPGMNLRPITHCHEPAFSFSYHQLATTVHKDEEECSSSLYNGANTLEPVVKFRDFYKDDETIVDQDLVVWVTLGLHHIPKTEDLPIVTSPGHTLYFTLKPFNYFPEDPSMSSREHVRVVKRKHPKGIVKEVTIPDDATCTAPDVSGVTTSYNCSGLPLD